MAPKGQHSAEAAVRDGVRPVYWGTFGVASRVPSSISNFKMERGTSLETLAGKGLILR